MKRICVLGLGYIGLPTALLFANNGYHVIGVDLKSEILKTLSKGKVHFQEKGLQELLDKALERKTFTVNSETQKADFFIICAPTPLDKHYHVSDLGYVKMGCEMIEPVLEVGNTIIIESTISPGSSETLFRKILEKSGLNAGTEFHLVHCPERAIPGNTLYEMINNFRIIGGFTPEGTKIAQELYSSFVPKEKLMLTDIRTAEIVKLMENTYRDLNIALANEFAMISEDLRINVWDAIKLANLHPRVNIHKPGPGVGGHCIAIDPWFLTENTFNAQLIATARNINDNMPNYALLLTKQLLEDQESFPIITILGVAYKGNVDDSRETPALKFIQLAEKQGFSIKIFDPHCNEFNGRDLLPLDEAVKDSDCIVLITDHDVFKNIDPIHIANLVKNKNLLDTRNHLDHDKWKKAGFNVKILGDGK
ncbi:MAG: nucleotide sugar dehydrogenase [Candidatus Heimdallarchaeota archaeon]|nr:nucleotide sugar dehydrogenase [Candidatus Heimdallarchaeota archaeon]